MESIKIYFISGFLCIFYANLISAQKINYDLPHIDYEITNDVLKEEINLFIKTYEKEYEGDKVISVLAIFDIKNLVFIYKIRYRTNFDFFKRKENRFKKIYPSIVTKYNNHYVFIYSIGLNSISISEKVMLEIGKICFPSHYESYLKDEYVFNNSHRQPVVELKFNYDKKIISKKIYEE